MSQALHPCVYAPLCSQVFAQHRSMVRHAENHHGGVNKIFCPECETLVFFKSVKSLRDHMAKVHTEQVACSSCGTMVKPCSLMKHMKRHPDAASFEAEVEEEKEDAEDEVEDKLVSAQLKYLIEPGVFIEREGKTRSEKRAPDEKLVKECLTRYLAHLNLPFTMGGTKVRKADQHLAKLRTVIGRLSKFLDKPPRAVLFILASNRRVCEVFSRDKLEQFIAYLTKADDGKTKLSLSTVYNYCSALRNYLEWKVKRDGCVGFGDILSEFDALVKSVSKDRNASFEPDEKARYIASLPSMPDIVQMMNDKLCPKAEQAYAVYKTIEAPTKADAILVYSALRDYLLVAMLFGYPPQRLQVFNALRVDNFKIVHNSVVFTIADHKTRHIYGSVVTVLPSVFKSAFDQYLEIRQLIAKCPSLFVTKSGNQEKRLTDKFEAAIYREFKKVVSIRDCRSIYVTYASTALSVTQLNELANRMYHSPQVQKRVYRSQLSADRAIDGVKIWNQLSLNAAMQDLNVEDECVLQIENGSSARVEEIDEDGGGSDTAGVQVNSFEVGEIDMSDDDPFYSVSYDQLVMATQEAEKEYEARMTQ